MPLNLRRFLTAAVVTLASLQLFACANFRTYTDAERKQRLGRGEILSYLKRIEGTKLSIGESQAIVDAPPARVWNAVTDYNRQAEIGPHTKKIDITRIEGDTVWVEMELRAPFFMDDPKYTLKVDHNKKEMRTNWNLVQGNIRECYGSWDVDPVVGEPSRSLVTYTLLYDDGSAMPQFIINTYTRLAVKDVMQILRDHVHDPIYDRPVYSISVLDPAAIQATQPAYGNGDDKVGSGKGRLDEETSEILR